MGTQERRDAAEEMIRAGDTVRTLDLAGRATQVDTDRIKTARRRFDRTSCPTS